MLYNSISDAQIDITLSVICGPEREVKLIKSGVVRSTSVRNMVLGDRSLV